MRIRRHRDGGFIVEVWGGTWMFDLVVARRRRDRWGRGNPFSVSLVTGMKED